MPAARRRPGRAAAAPGVIGTGRCASRPIRVAGCAGMPKGVSARVSNGAGMDGGLAVNRGCVGWGFGVSGVTGERVNEMEDDFSNSGVEWKYCVLKI